MRIRRDGRTGDRRYRSSNPATELEMKKEDDEDDDGNEQQKVYFLTLSLFWSHETDKFKLGGIVAPLMMASGRWVIPICSATEIAVDIVAVAVSPRKHLTPKRSRKT